MQDLAFTNYKSFVDTAGCMHDMKYRVSLPIHRSLDGDPFLSQHRFSTHEKMLLHFFKTFLRLANRANNSVNVPGQKYRSEERSISSPWSIIQSY